MFEIFPNPNNGQITLSSKTIDLGPLNIECYNSMGQVIYRGNAFPNQPIDFLQNESAGIYNLMITTYDGKKYQNKLLKY